MENKNIIPFDHKKWNRNKKVKLFTYLNKEEYVEVKIVDFDEAVGIWFVYSKLLKRMFEVQECELYMEALKPKEFYVVAFNSSSRLTLYTEKVYRSFSSALVVAKGRHRNGLSICKVTQIILDNESNV